MDSNYFFAWRADHASRVWPLTSAAQAWLLVLVAWVLPAAAGLAQPVLPGATSGQAAPSQLSSLQLVEAARAAARNDRNQESADLFRRAIQQAPERRRDLLQEYADQLTYSSRASQAVPLYREVLADPTQRDERLRVLRSLGLALLWSDRPGQARDIYEELLREEPADQDARRNLGRALSWSGRQREASVMLRDFLQQHPDDQEARVQLAQTQVWSGRPDLAQRTLDGANTMEREDARRLQRDIDRAAAPRTRANIQRSTQSDQLNIQQANLTHDISFDQGLGSVGVGLDRLKFEREDGTDSVQVSRPMLRGRYRFSEAAELNGEVGQERIEPRGRAPIDRGVYSTWFTWWPGDMVRVDFSAKRSTFDNLRSLRQGLTATQQAVSVELTPDERQRYRAQLERGIYSDGNRRQFGQIEGEYRWLNQPESWVGLRHTRFGFSQLLDNGYFNPKDFHATHLTLRLIHRPQGYGGPWDLGAFAVVGREYANPDGSKPTYDVSLLAGWRLDPRTRLEARVQRFSSRTSAFSGFARTTVGLSLEGSW